MKKLAALIIGSSLLLSLFAVGSQASEPNNHSFFVSPCKKNKPPQLPSFATLDNGVMSIGTKVIVKKVLTPNPYLSTNHSIIIPENSGIFVVDDKTPPPAPLKRTILFKTNQTNKIQTNKTNETNAILNKQTKQTESKQTGVLP